MSTSSLVIGIDGGGTKTVAWLAPLDDTTNTIVLGCGQSGPGNPRAVGFEVAQGNIAAAIAAAFAEAKVPPTAVSAACYGLAGAGRDSEQRRIEDWALSEGIAHAVRVCGDAEPILAAAAPDNCGVALICGTGSLAWGRNREGKAARSGGWGYLLGDEGSGYAIGLAGLNAAVRAADGRGQSTSLLDRVLRAFNAATPQDLIDCVYAPEMTRERLADLCKLVFDAATDDCVARTIVDNAAAQLAAMVAVLCRRLDLRTNDYPLALAGSVILNQPSLRFQLSEQLNASGQAPSSVSLVPHPVRGAVALARALAAS